MQTKQKETDMHAAYQSHTKKRKKKGSLFIVLIRDKRPHSLEMLSRGETASASTVGASDLPPWIKMRDGMGSPFKTLPRIDLKLTLKAPNTNK